MRPDGRDNRELRPVSIHRNYIKTAHGSTLVEFGDTRIVCTAMVEDRVPHWLHRSGKGWISAEYSMLPGSTAKRKNRNRGGQTDGRMVEIQRLIGRSLRAVAKTELIGERTIWLDCDVLQADAGTRTASITGAYVALCDAVAWLKKSVGYDADIITGQVAAVSVGLCNGEPCVDLCYLEDESAEVDLNVVMLDDGNFVEIQGTGEKCSFSNEHLQQMLGFATEAIQQLFEIQREALNH